MTAPTSYRLFLFAHGRSGDKGDTVNIGVIARREEWYELLKRELSADRVRAYLEPLGIGDVERFELPNLGALNFLVRHALGGGGAMALKLDAQGKTFAQALLHMPLHVSERVAAAMLADWGERLPADCVLDGAG
jgi:hypothetical protein